VNAFELVLITPAGVRRVPDAVFLDVPAASGRLTVLPRHEPLVCQLKAGTLRWRAADGSADRVQVPGGVLTVSAGRAAVATPDAVQMPSP
jgi:F0F1-type ATP synthase epsilon subunit